VAGMGLIFEMPILVFFLAFLGILSPGFMLKQFRYAVLIIFVIAGVVTPTPDIVNMCIFAAPMLLLYGISVGVAWLVHPEQRQKREEKKAA
jgi:sec-independent protein translocase protein TatC